jgi:hypothetical protein
MNYYNATQFTDRTPQPYGGIYGIPSGTLFLAPTEMAAQGLYGSFPTRPMYQPPVGPAPALPAQDSAAERPLYTGPLNWSYASREMVPDGYRPPAAPRVGPVDRPAPVFGPAAKTLKEDKEPTPLTSAQVQAMGQVADLGLGMMNQQEPPAEFLPGTAGLPGQAGPVGVYYQNTMPARDTRGLLY